MDTSVADGGGEAAVDSATIDVPDGGFPTPGRGDIVISEMMIDSDAIPDDFGEWFELHNPSTTQTYSLDGCSFFDDARATEMPVGVILLPGSYTSFAIGSAPGFTPDYVYTSGMKLSNDDPDSLTIRCGPTDVDVVAYEVTPTWPWAKGNSLSLDPASLDAGDNDLVTSWCAGSVEYNRGGGDIDYGTPGTANPDCP
ncbi:MAG: hypothetical protein GWN07_24210 [Actinobacteria bacterium]|nr:lamin tail domain-containing protein [Actinomycetota bacterium]NIU68520.1 lamin tail domain-containing protein [Actinomycetota bacterium]NIW30345.1 hypothetical protein [Actinomycetota bacterium]NIX22761.1 hypothetical protein [Actinomycetota bacterium]